MEIDYFFKNISIWNIFFSYTVASNIQNQQASKYFKKFSIEQNFLLLLALRITEHALIQRDQHKVIVWKKISANPKFAYYEFEYEITNAFSHKLYRGDEKIQIGVLIHNVSESDITIIPRLLNFVPID